jgi:hypothetical protein
MATVLKDSENIPNGMVKLKAEAATPFRLLRVFIASSLGIAGGIGSITGLAKLLQDTGHQSQTSLAAAGNLAINIAGVVSAIAYLRWEDNRNKKLLAKFALKQAELENRPTRGGLTARDKALSMLPVEIQVSSVNENATRTVSLRDLQARGKQGVVILAGSKEFLSDATLAARLIQETEFAENNIMMIPVCIDSAEHSEESANFKVGVEKDALTKPSHFATPQQVRSCIPLQLAFDYPSLYHADPISQQCGEIS